MIERTETPAPASAPSKTWDVAIVGAGYVGVPLACTFATAGRSVLLVDVVQKVVDALNRGESHIEDVPSAELGRLVAGGRLAATTDYDALRGADAILIALPTPLSKQREPDLSIVVAATREIAKRLREGQLVVLGSTTDPGTTREPVLPSREPARLTAGEDGHRAFPPERGGPGAPGAGQRGGLPPRRGAVRLGDRGGAHGLVPGGGRADEAPREHLPLGQHRARQRARTALRPDGDRRLGGRRRSGDEAVRFHELQAGPGPRRALHPGRPVLSHVEGARVRLHDRVHRARRQGQRGDAVLL